jgi:hypothetical protein
MDRETSKKLSVNAHCHAKTTIVELLNGDVLPHCLRHFPRKQADQGTSADSEFGELRILGETNAPEWLRIQYKSTKTEGDAT